MIFLNVSESLLLLFSLSVVADLIPHLPEGQQDEEHLEQAVMICHQYVDDITWFCWGSDVV